MRTPLTLRFEFDKSFPNEIYVFDRISNRVYGKVIPVADLQEYVESLMRTAINCGDHGSTLIDLSSND